VITVDGVAVAGRVVLDAAAEVVLFRETSEIFPPELVKLLVILLFTIFHVDGALDRFSDT
jgi:hypothetical protein